MLIAVAGASGRLGQNFLKKLMKKGHKVVVLLRSKSSAKKIPSSANQRYVSYESSDLSDLKKTLADVTHIVNITGSTATYLPENELTKANVDATKKLLEAAPPSLKKFIHISSIAVYGKHFEGIYDENSPKRADGAYAKTKLAGERAVLSYKKNFDVVILQPGMVYGPGFEGGFYPILQKIRDGKMKIIGSGANHIPLVHVDDVSTAILNTLGANVPSGSSFILVTEPQFTQLQLISMAASLFRVTSPTQHTNYGVAKLYYRAKEIYLQFIGKKPSVTLDMIEQLHCDRRFSSKRAAMSIQFKPAVSFKMGIEQVVNAFLKEKNG